MAEGLEKMRAVVVHAPMDFRLEEVTLPEIEPGGLLLKVEACGLCGSDLRTLRSGHRKVKFPWIIGHEICGEVVAAGPEYEGPWQIGERLAAGPLVYCGACDFCMDGNYDLCANQRELAQAWPGGFAEYIALPEDYVRLGSVLRAPEGLDSAYAAISEPMSSCVNAQEKAAVGLGDTVVIIGTGPIGCIHTALARARGADRVFVVDIVQDRLDMAEAFGTDAAINASEVDTVDAVMNLTNGGGADVVITATPAPIASVQAVEMARKAGRIVIFGGLPKDNSKPGVDMNVVHYNALHIIGTTTFAPRHQRSALELMQSGRIPAEKLVTHRLPLEKFAEGVELAMEGKALKVVFTP
jgi:L-iditol 2-dehydrogenase